jgi:hypothetical protein
VKFTHERKHKINDGNSLKRMCDIQLNDDMMMAMDFKKRAEEKRKSQ